MNTIGSSRYSARLLPEEEVATLSADPITQWCDEQYDALFDPITGVATRALLRDRIAVAVRRANRVCKRAVIVYLEIRAPESTAAIARSIVEGLESVLRADDTIARVAAEEYVIVCNDLTDDDHVRLIVGRIVDKVHRPLAIAGQPTHLVSRVGIVFGRPQRDARDLLDEARRAMLADDWSPLTITTT